MIYKDKNSNLKNRKDVIEFCRCKNDNLKRNVRKPAF